MLLTFSKIIPGTLSECQTVWVQIMSRSKLSLALKELKCTSVPEDCIYLIANNADPDGMLHIAEFHLGLHCLPKYITGLDKKKNSAYNCKYFLTHNFKHMFWVLERTVSLRQEALLSTHNIFMFWLRNKKIIFLLHTLNQSPVTCTL